MTSDRVAAVGGLGVRLGSARFEVGVGDNVVDTMAPTRSLLAIHTMTQR